MAEEDLDIPRNDRAALSQPPRRRRLLPMLLLLILVAAGGLVGWQYLASLSEGSGQGEIPMVRADPGPVKVRPDDPGGMKIPNQDKLVYERLGEGAAPMVERLMPSAEKPMAPPMPSGASVPMPPPAAMPAPAPAPAPMMADAAPPARRALPTDTAASRQAAVAPPPPPPPAAVTPAPAPAPAASPAPAPPKPAPAVAASPTPAPPPAAAAGGDWLLQLGALRSEAAARQEWERLKKGHADLLGSYTLTVQRAEVAGKGTFYRIRVGSLADRAAATAVCGKLALRKVGCFVVKR